MSVSSSSLRMILPVSLGHTEDSPGEAPVSPCGSCGWFPPETSLTCFRALFCCFHLVHAQAWSGVLALLR